MKKTYLVTGGAGFIGSNFILTLFRECDARVVNLDKLTYAGNPLNLESLNDDPGYVFIRGDIGDQELVRKILAEHKPDYVVNFAAESHVDRSILGPEAFIETNVMGTFRLLQAVREYWTEREKEDGDFRFLHVSTDEVYGSLGPGDPPFTETTPYDPSSPYSASKAASDHLVRSYHRTYGLPALITNCSNNYGPRQFPEKLIPLMILNALEGKPLPVYGDGMNVRDWLYVDDHCRALLTVLEKGKIGETYNIGGACEKPNIEIVKGICSILDELKPGAAFSPRESLITYVTDRPGHDRRYAMNIEKIERDLGWTPAESFESGLMKTIRWYLENEAWAQSIRSGDYLTWIEENYGAR